MIIPQEIYSPSQNSRKFFCVFFLTFSSFKLFPTWYDSASISQCPFLCIFLQQNETSSLFWFRTIEFCLFSSSWHIGLWTFCSFIASAIHLKLPWVWINLPWAFSRIQNIFSLISVTTSHFWLITTQATLKHKCTPEWSEVWKVNFYKKMKRK